MALCILSPENLFLKGDCCGKFVYCSLCNACAAGVLRNLRKYISNLATVYLKAEAVVPLLCG